MMLSWYKTFESKQTLLLSMQEVDFNVLKLHQAIHIHSNIDNIQRKEESSTKIVD
jgi:hypothetical protein